MWRTVHSNPTMTHITGHDRSQTLLLPEALDDYVGPENPVRFIEAFVGFRQNSCRQGQLFFHRVAHDEAIMMRAMRLP